MCDMMETNSSYEISHRKTIENGSHFIWKRNKVSKIYLVIYDDLPYHSMCAYMYTVLYGGFLFSRYTFVLQSLKCCDQRRVIWLGKKISIINNPGFHRGKLRSWVLDVGGEEPRATSAVTATRPAVGVHYSEYIGLSFTLHTTSQLFIRHVLL